MHIGLPSTIAAAALLVSLAGCAGPPQQPSDVVDDRSRFQPDAEQQQTAEAEPFGVATPVEPDGQIVETPTAAITPQDGSAIATQTEVSAITGTWGASLADCGRGTEVTVTQTQYSSLDRMCEINSAISGGAAGSLTLSLDCTNPAGEFESELLTLTPIEDGTAMDVNVVGGETPQRLMRCPDVGT